MKSPQAGVVRDVRNQFPDEPVRSMEQPNMNQQKPLRPLKSVVRILVAAAAFALHIHAQGATTRPFFTNTLFTAGGFAQTEVRLPSNGLYTLMYSKDLISWDYDGMLPNNTNRVILTSSSPVVGENENHFYRIGIGSISFPVLFLTFDASPGSIVGTVGTRTYPETNIYSIGAVFQLNHVDNPLPAASVLFTGPPSSGVTQVGAGAQGGGPSDDYDYVEWYSIGGIQSGPSALAGSWTINYGSNVYVLKQPDPAFTKEYVVVTPAVALSNGFVTSVSWAYRNPTNGAVLSPLPSCVRTIHLYLNSNSTGTLFNTDIPGSSTNYVLSTPVQWSQVDYIYTDYTDTVGNYYSDDYFK
jgi:hypothetical protein